MIYECLGIGEENAIYAAALCERLNLTGRELRKKVERERMDGAPICASIKGYFIASCYEDMKRYCDLLISRRIATETMLEACMESLKKLPKRNTEDEQG